MAEMLQMSLTKIEFGQENDLRTAQARVFFKISASTIVETEIAFLVPWKGNLADVQTEVDKLIRDLGATLARYKQEPAPAPQPTARSRK